MTKRTKDITFGCHSKCDNYKTEKELRTKERQGLIREHENRVLGIYKEK